ncbi:hypothetical protein MTP99_014969 [Tenebrio molitor]|nr:hypothetical protein MTP99_014969 [Tenebrio molitor]
MGALAKLCFVVLVVLVLETSALPSRIKRQGFNWNTDDSSFEDNRQRPRPRPTPAPSTAPSGTTTTTASPEYNSCIRRCPTTPQYNPICGSNRITYQNESHLRCANRCGLTVERAFGGSCSAL